MSALTKILTGAAGLAAVVGFASPASAQYYPSYPNQGYGYPNQGGNVVGQILQGVLGGGYGQYPYGNYGYGQVNQRQAVSQCAAAVEQRLNYRGGYGGYNQYGYGNQGYGGYNQYGYGNQAYAGGRVQGITKVERKSYGVKVFGVASSGNRGSAWYGKRSTLSKERFERTSSELWMYCALSEAQSRLSASPQSGTRSRCTTSSPTPRRAQTFRGSTGSVTATAARRLERSGRSISARAARASVAKSNAESCSEPSHFLPATTKHTSGAHSGRAHSSLATLPGHSRTATTF